VRWTYYGRQQVFLGISPTPTFEFIEEFWGLRHIEKTPVDLYRLDSSRDFGVNLQGPLNASHTVKYSAQFGNDASQNSETNEQKGARFSVRYEGNPGFVAEAFYGYLARDMAADRQIAQGFVGYQQKRGRAGLQYTYQERKAASNTTNPDLGLDVVSVFGVFTARPNRWTVFGRFDRFNDPNPDAGAIDYLELDPRAKFNFAIAGVEYYFLPQFRFSPNVEWASYHDLPDGTSINDDVVWRATFYVSWP
jgi:predicted porin